MRYVLHTPISSAVPLRSLQEWVLQSVVFTCCLLPFLSRRNDDDASDDEECDVAGMSAASAVPTAAMVARRRSFMVKVKGRGSCSCLLPTSYVVWYTSTYLSVPLCT